MHKRAARELLIRALGYHHQHSLWSGRTAEESEARRHEFDVVREKLLIMRDNRNLGRYATDRYVQRSGLGL